MVLEYSTMRTLLYLTLIGTYILEIRSAHHEEKPNQNFGSSFSSFTSPPNQSPPLSIRPPPNQPPPISTRPPRNQPPPISTRPPRPESQDSGPGASTVKPDSINIPVSTSKQFRPRNCISNKISHVLSMNLLKSADVLSFIELWLKATHSLNEKKD